MSKCPFPTLIFCIDKHSWGIVFYKHISSLAQIMNFMQLCLNILGEMANSVEPDQIAPELDLHCLYMPFC